MARERAKLSEKQERILIQCQLMGLTPKDMQQISNRLIALEREAAWKREIEEASHSMTWGKSEKGWIITTDDGRVFDCKRVKKDRSRNWYDRSSSSWDVEITKPTTRFKPKQIKDVGVYVDQYIPARMCPDNSKDLYGLVLAIHNGRVR